MKGTVLPLEGLNAKEQKRLMVLNRMMGGVDGGGGGAGAFGTPGQEAIGAL